MQVDTNVAEGDVGRLQVGMKTSFTVDSFPGERFLGTIRQIRNAATTVQNVVTYDAVIDVDNPDLRLRPGMTANVTVIYAERKGALALANTALRFRPPPSLAGSSPQAASRGPGVHRRGDAGGGGATPTGSGYAPMADAPESKTIWVMKGGTPEAVSVHVGLSDGTVTEIVDGDVGEGDEVVVDAQGAEPATPAPGAAPSLRRPF
jgi:HlyD family secretion protein